uniref:AAA+ ATPase domain-containing protein n=1 Tax=Schistosoma curassoni TaxID=6186 RepID=A0A183L3D6_9TREM
LLQGCDGGILLIVGPTGSGKTTYLSALTISLIESDWYRSFSTNNTIQKKFNSKLHSSEQLVNSMENSKFISKQRPIFAKHQIFIHFCNGLSISGLPSNRKLNEILQNWLNLLTIQLDNICNCNDILRKLFNEMKSSFSVNIISSNINLKFNIQCFARFIQFIGYLNDIQFAFLIDDCDQLEPMTLEWLPQILPKVIDSVKLFSC